MRNLFVKTALVLCTTIIFLPATVFATEPQNTEITSAEEGFTDSDPSVSYENDNSLTLDEKEDDSTSTEPPAEDEKTPDKADTDKENPDPDIFTSGDDFGDGSKSNPFHVVIDSDNPEDGDTPQITDPVIDNCGIISNVYCFSVIFCYINTIRGNYIFSRWNHGVGIAVTVVFGIQYSFFDTFQSSFIAVHHDDLQGHGSRLEVILPCLVCFFKAHMIYIS